MLALIEQNAAALGISLVTAGDEDDSTLISVRFATPLQGHLSSPRSKSQPGEGKLSILLYLQQALGSLPAGLYEYTDGALRTAAWSSNEALWTLQKGDTANIIYDAAFVMILFSDGSREGHIATGKFLQVFMLEAARKIGLCPLGRIGLPSDFPAPNLELTLAVAGGALDNVGSEAKTWQQFLFEHLHHSLPIHMVPQPSDIFLLPKIPLTASGKLDRKDIPKPERSVGVSVSFTPEQARLAGLWSKVGVVPSSASCSFFDNGGDSQKLRTLRHLVKEEFGLQGLSISTLFHDSTLQRMTEAARREAAKQPKQHKDSSLSQPIGRMCQASKAQMSIFKAISQLQGLASNCRFYVHTCSHMFTHTYRHSLTHPLTHSLSIYIYTYIHKQVYLSIYPSIHLSIYPSTHLSIYPSLHLSVCLSIYLSLYLSVYLSICLCIYLYLSIYLSLSLSLSLSIYLSISLSISIYLYLSISLSLSPSPALSIYLSVYLSISIYRYLSISIYLYLSLSISIYLYLSLSISIYLYLSLSISIYLYLSLPISIYLTIYLTIYLPIYLSLSISLYLYLSLPISIYLYLSLSISIYLYLSLSISIYLYLSLPNST